MYYSWSQSMLKYETEQKMVSLSLSKRFRLNCEIMNLPIRRTSIIEDYCLHFVSLFNKWSSIQSLQRSMVTTSLDYNRLRTYPDKRCSFPRVISFHDLFRSYSKRVDTLIKKQSHLISRSRRGLKSKKGEQNVIQCKPKCREMNIFKVPEVDSQLPPHKGNKNPFTQWTVKT